MSDIGNNSPKKRKRECNLHEYAKSASTLTKRANINKTTNGDGLSQTQINYIGFNVPVYGTPVNRRDFRRAGPYIIGPKFGYSPVESIVQYLGKHETTGKFVNLKILMLNNKNNKVDRIIQDERQGKMLLHTEFSLLSMLENQAGVVHHHGLFSDVALEEDHNQDDHRNAFYTGEINKRLILVLDCYFAHDFCKESSAIINLQKYLLINKKMTEMEALKIFYEIILVVESLHKKNIIHRDLKLANLVLNRNTNKITIVNFCLGKYLINENDLLYDQRGSPVYISPDVLSGQPYKGKPSDMWALGVVLFMMFYGQFPFYESTTSALFVKIKSAEYSIPINSEISHESQGLIKGLLQLEADQRLNASEVRSKIESIFATKPVSCVDQFVPCFQNEHQKSITKPKKLNLISTDQVVPNLCNNANIQNGIVENISQRPAEQTFLRPITGILVQRVNRDARPLTQNEIGQFHPLLQNISHDDNNTSNWHRLRNSSYNVTQQMSNLSIRNRQNVHARLNRTTDANDNTDNSSTLSNSRENDVNNILNTLRLRVRLNELFYRCALLRPHLITSNLTQDNSGNILSQSQLVPNVSPTQSSANSLNYSSVQSLFISFNEMFIRGRIPIVQTSNLIEFTGTITDDLATKISQWLINEFPNHVIIQSVFNGTVENATNKVCDLFSRCGIQMQATNGIVKVNREQSLDLLIVLTYMLQASGYNNTYFVT